MGKCRFLYNNLITDESMLAVSSLKLGVVTTALKEGVGAAVITPSGNFTGPVDLEYVIEIDGLGSGEIGSSTFRWSDDGGATWHSGVTLLEITDPACVESDGTHDLIFTGGTPSTPATGTYTILSNVITAVNIISGGAGYASVPTVATQTGDGTIVARLNLTSAIDLTLSDGVKIKWTGLTGADDFALADKWYFKGVNLYNPGKMLDFDRDSRFRTLDATGAKTITITFASQKPTALIIYDHNLPAGSTIILTGADGAKAVTWAADKILHYIDAADGPSATWILTITAAGAPAYIEIGELFLGPYMEFSKTFRKGFGEEPGFLMDTNITSYGIDRDRFYGEGKMLSYAFEFMPSADLALKKAFVTALGNVSTGIFKRFWFNENSAIPGDVIMAKLISWPHTHNTVDFYDMSLQMTEVLRSI